MKAAEAARHESKTRLLNAALQAGRARATYPR